MSKKNNIVFIFIESFDGRKIGCLGNPALKNATPNMDQVAKHGVIFSNMYASHPLCCPVRANLWSGTYSFRHESWNNYKGLEPGTPRFQDVLEKEGYVFASKKGGYGKHDYSSGRHTVMARVTAWTSPANIQVPVYRQAKPRVSWFPRKKTNILDWASLKQAKMFLKRQAKKQESEDAKPFFLY
ncbi:MAG: sulfatase-like hydrolase/transferase, partial [Candidatus Lokiarchaeota archaeon]|nr:sulfatase-like hydrolase/transferase [Candidatus Lokiarchaeota archaeon]